MGKRDGDGHKKSKKHKRHKAEKLVVESHSEDVIVDEEDVAAGENCMELVEHEEEIVCDGEVEISQHDNEMDCVEVEVSEEVEIEDEDWEEEDEVKVSESEIEMTPPPKPSTSKAAAAMEAVVAAEMQQFEAKSSPQSSQSPAGTTPMGAMIKAGKANASKKRRDSGTSSEEERWLTAIEAGKLEEIDDELKKMKDPKLMTARQRAMYDRNQNESEFPAELLMALPSGYKEKEKPQTAEEIQKAALKSLKRKQMADEKREKDKKKTMERLLKKQESKQKSAASRRNAKPQQPMISYRNHLDENGESSMCIHLPEGIEFPMKPQVAKPPPAKQLCGIPGCGQLKAYNCSKTNLPLCSFACYRKNVQSLKQIMC